MKNAKKIKRLHNWLKTIFISTAINAIRCGEWRQCNTLQELDEKMVHVSWVAQSYWAPYPPNMSRIPPPIFTHDRASRVGIRGCNVVSRGVGTRCNDAHCSVDRSALVALSRHLAKIHKLIILRNNDPLNTSGRLAAVQATHQRVRVVGNLSLRFLLTIIRVIVFYILM